jgi:hypothetical protein
MLSLDMRESLTRTIEFPDRDPGEWVRFCRYVEPRPFFTVNSFHVNEEDIKTLLPWFHHFGMTKLVQECDERLSISSPRFWDNDLDHVDHRRSIMTDILGWADKATIYDLSKTLDAAMKELKKAVNTFPETITAEILENMSPFWSTTAGTELREAVKAILPDDVKSSHNDAALNADQHRLFELVAQSGEAPAQIQTLKSEGDLNGVVNLMKKYRSCPRIQQNGCAAFRDHTSSAVKDGIEVIVSAMATYKYESKVQEQGCAALGNLAGNDDNRVSIAAKHGIEAIVSAMTVHINMGEVQEQGCGAIGNLVCSNDTNRVSIATKSGIVAIVRAMTTHTYELKVQVRGCLALGNIASNDANCVSIAAKHGIQAIVRAMTVHVNKSKVQEYGCLALSNLTFNDSVAIRGIQLEEGGLAVLEHNPSNSNAETALQRIKALASLG